MTTSEKRALDNLINKTVNYKDKAYLVKNYKQLSTGYIIVYTNKSTFNFLPSELEEFIKTARIIEEKQTWAPVQTDAPQKTEIVVQLPAENQPLKTTLLEVLREIKENPTPENLKKAESICNVSNTLINIQKTEIQLLRMQKKLTK